MSAFMFADKPYTFRLRRSFKSVIWFWREWEILFEETPIRIMTSPVDDVKELVDLMNTAWALGFDSGSIFTMELKEINNIATESQA